MTIHKIGTQVYAVHKAYVDNKSIGGIVRVCKIKTYENIGGKILPVLGIGKSNEIKLDRMNHYIYDSLEEAVNAIDINKTLIKKSKSNGKKHK